MSVRLVHCHIYAFAMQTFLMSFLQEAKEWSNGARSLRLTFIGTWRPFLFIICSHKLHSVQCLGDWPCPCPLPVKPLPHGTWVYATCIHLGAAEFCMISATTRTTRTTETALDNRKPQKQLKWTRNRTELGVPNPLKVAKIGSSDCWLNLPRFNW